MSHRNSYPKPSASKRTFRRWAVRHFAKAKTGVVGMLEKQGFHFDSRAA